MERSVRAYFRVVRLNRWAVAGVLLLLLGLVLWPGRSLVPVGGEPTLLVRDGVTVLGLDFSGKGEREARAMLNQLATAYQAAPVDARSHLDALGNVYVVPELNGFALDVDMTWLRLAMAPPGAAVEPVARIDLAAKRLADFPQGVIRQGNGEKQVIGLLVNVDWGDREVGQMLPVLKRKGAQVTFFVSGNWAQKHPNLLKLMAADGHEIATHGHNLSQGPRALAAAGRLQGDIEQSVQTIETITGKDVRYYAPHMSEVSPAVLQAASALKLRTVLYSIDTVDWRESTTTDMILAKFQQAKAGDLILLHPKPNTVKALEGALDQVVGRGLKPVTLSELLSPDPGRPAGSGGR